MKYRSFLLIDDDLDDHFIFQLALQEVSSDAICQAFSDAEIAVRRIEEEGLTFDIAFVDLNMPRVDGFQFLEMAKKVHSLSKIPIYMLSTTSSPEISKKALDMGAVTLVTKFTTMEPLVKFLSGFV